METLRNILEISLATIPPAAFRRFSLSPPGFCFFFFPPPDFSSCLKQPRLFPTEKPPPKKLPASCWRALGECGAAQRPRRHPEPPPELLQRFSNAETPPAKTPSPGRSRPRRTRLALSSLPTYFLPFSIFFLLLKKTKIEQNRSVDEGNF